MNAATFRSSSTTRMRMSRWRLAPGAGGRNRRGWREDAMLERVDQIQMAVADTVEAARTFGDLLGPEPAREEDSEYLNAGRTILTLGDSEVELCAPRGAGGRADVSRARRDRRHPDGDRPGRRRAPPGVGEPSGGSRRGRDRTPTGPEARALHSTRRRSAGRAGRALDPSERARRPAARRLALHRRLGIVRAARAGRPLRRIP